MGFTILHNDFLEVFKAQSRFWKMLALGFHAPFRRKSVDYLAAWLAAWLVEFCHVFVWLFHFERVFTWLSDARCCSHAVYLISRGKIAALAGWLVGMRFSHSFPR